MNDIANSGSTEMHRILRLHDEDNVVVSLDDIAAGSQVDGHRVTADIPKGHKVASAIIEVGEPIRKYSQIIGVASETISPGDHVHTHNVSMCSPNEEIEFASEIKEPGEAPEPAFFEGYLRPDGQAATRNYVGILTSVNCSATVANAIAGHFANVSNDYPNVDGVVALTHNSGCAMGGDGRALQLLRRTMAGFARHPNFIGVLVVGLGCESNQLPGLMEQEQLAEGERFRVLSIQEQGGTTATVKAGIEIVKGMLAAGGNIERQPLPVSHLKLALQCGGSDAFSGITANPALGSAVDRLVEHGATAILSETPEVYGAHHLLARRARSQQVGAKLIELLEAWESRAAMAGGNMDNNPSPGNIAGGLTTILEKSLGAVAKGGTSTLQAVLDYAEPLASSGLVFMDSPGYDPIAVTGQVASGANVVAFTTGRGSVFGCKPAPSIKLATTSALYERMTDDMDINCGAILDGEYSIAEMGQVIFDEVVRVASGQRTKSEVLGFGDSEFTPWILGTPM